MPRHAGDYNYRLKIQQPIYTTAASGQRTIVAWVDVVNAWANLEQLGGDETFGSDQRSQSQRVSFRIRFVTGITPQMHFLHRGQRYDIKSVEEAERRTELRLVAEVFEAET